MTRLYAPQGGKCLRSQDFHSRSSPNCGLADGATRRPRNNQHAQNDSVARNAEEIVAFESAARRRPGALDSGP